MGQRFQRRRFLQLVGWTIAGAGLTAFGIPPRPASQPRSFPPSPAPDLQPVRSNPRSNTGSNKTISIGLLHSLSGRMAIAEKSTLDAELLAIEEINKTGGILGREIEPILEDGASDWVQFAEKAQKLIRQDRVLTIFGCWTSASRKSVLPAFETENSMLWYPVYYEGQECSKNLFYTGAVPNQQVEPSVDWMLKTFPGQTCFLVGSDYVYPRVINTVLKTVILAKKGTYIGEEYLPLGDANVDLIIHRIRQAMPKGGVILNSLNGDSNIALFTALKQQGMTPKRYPVLSFTISEEEVAAIGSEYLMGHYAAWNYFQTLNSEANQKFVKAFHGKYGSDRRLNDPIASAYTAVYLWKQAVEKAGTTKDLEAIRRATIGQTMVSPMGRVTIHRNHHLSKPFYIGKVRSDGLFNIVYGSTGPIAPVPWSQAIAATKGYACDWTDPKKGGKFKTKKDTHNEMS
ncbi:urea ABC transporter substrate-binding protein [Alkalinema pantanalense CENA528]|uniref:urea ABC transporter substrate-binding protein n=1 Tax=Alkalinema pantanalense TaxID=1620705 RepID=UPI003D6FCD2D